MTTKVKNPFRFYVYAYLRSKDSETAKAGTPYYIGKGNGDRAWKKHGRIKLPSNKSNIVLLETNLSEVGALALEQRYIRWYGKLITNTGILRNLADGGMGTADVVHVQDLYGTKLSISTKEFYLNRNKYIASNDNYVVVKGINKNYKITKEEYSTGEYKHVTSGLVSISGSKYKITQEEFDKGGYFGVNKGLVSGSDNPRAKIIHIFDSTGVLQYACNGNFQITCNSNNLPHISLRKSHVNNGSPIFKTVRQLWYAKKNGYENYIGWYAKELS
jgi:hypothetical protein